MSKRKHTEQSNKWKDFYAKISGKRTGKKSGSENAVPDVLTVQRLSVEVEGKCQKYSRIGALTMVPFGHELSMDNVKQACKLHFKISKHMECDLLAGERGPSFTDIQQITNWKLLHVRFIESSSEEVESINIFDRESEPASAGPVSSHNSPVKSWEQMVPIRSFAMSACKSRIPASVPLSAMVNLGKFIPPKSSRGLVTVQLEEFSVDEKKWLDPFDVRLSLKSEKCGGFRNAFECTALSGLKGKFVLKKFQEDKCKVS